MRYRLMATYRGVPYEVGLGPSNSDVVLFAACPPPEDLGFEPATGHWRKQVIRAEIDTLWESRPVGTFRGEPCIVLDDPGERLHIAYLGSDAERAVNLGYWQVDRGVFELLAPREEVTGLVEERVDKPLRWGEHADETGPMASYPYGRAPWPIAASPVPAPRPAPAPAPPAEATSAHVAPAADTELADDPLTAATPADHLSADAQADDALQAKSAPASDSPTNGLRASIPPADTQPATAPATGIPQATALPAEMSRPAPPADIPRPSGPPADIPRPNGPPADIPRPGGPPADIPRASSPPADIPRPSGPPADIPRASGPPTDIPRPGSPPTDVSRASGLPADGSRVNAPLTDPPPLSASSDDDPMADTPLANAALASAPLADVRSAAVPSAGGQRATGAFRTGLAQPTASAPAEDSAQLAADTWPTGVNARMAPFPGSVAGDEAPSFPAEEVSDPLPVPPGFYDPESAALADITPATDSTPTGDVTPAHEVRSRTARRQRVPTREIFCELADQASIPRAAYALETETDGAMCLLPTPDGFEVFIAADGVRHELRSFADEEAAYFYLFGVLVAEAIRSGTLAPAVGAANPYGGTV
jgi:hypothetical protein